LILFCTFSPSLYFLGSWQEKRLCCNSMWQITSTHQKRTRTFLQIYYF
jgi:hypothetical protein